MTPMDPIIVLILAAGFALAFEWLFLAADLLISLIRLHLAQMELKATIKKIKKVKSTYSVERDMRKK